MDILLVDDEPLVGESLAEFIQDNLGHSVVRCDNPESALREYKQRPFDIVMTDICMPGMDGISMINKLKEIDSGNPEFIVFTAYADKTRVLQALRAGVSDFLEKPIDVMDLSRIINKISRKMALSRDVKFQQYEPASKIAPPASIPETSQFIFKGIPDFGTVYFFSNEMKNCMSLIERFHEDGTIPVMITGETGVGKEVVARLVHFLNNDSKLPFISINCTAIPAPLFESELFGYDSGAFTGAKKGGMKGKFELAQGGTLFLDEIGDMPLELQPKLLRAIQEREIYRIGGQKKISLDIRFICSTNKNLQEMMSKGEFRSDLFYRLNTGRINVPPLREQKESIAHLAQAFLEEYAEIKGRSTPYLTKETVEFLKSYPWPGNVRELKNALELVVLLYNEVAIEPRHLHFLMSSDNHDINSHDNEIAPGSISLPDKDLPLAEIEREIVKKALLKFNGNKTQTAKYLGLTRSELRTKLKNI